jgi:hypothetical protein
MELRNWNVGLRQQVQRGHHAEIPIQNSYSHFSHRCCNLLKTKIVQIVYRYSVSTLRKTKSVSIIKTSQLSSLGGGGGKRI